MTYAAETASKKQGVSASLKVEDFGKDFRKEKRKKAEVAVELVAATGAE